MRTLVLLLAAASLSCAGSEARRMPPSAGPVVVGLDLVPADYTCRGTRAHAPADATLRMIDVDVFEWASRRSRSDVHVQSAAHDGWLDSRVCDAPCVFRTTDATGHVSIPLTGGPLWFVTELHFPDASGQRGAAAVLGVELGPDDTTLSLPLLTPQTVNQLVSSGVGGLTALGVVRDCAGAPVHRVWIRHFDESGNELDPTLSGTLVLYADGHGSFGATDRTTIDGAFVLHTGEAFARIEAWGARSFGGPEELLGCRVVSLPNTIGAFVDILPLERDAPSACGTGP